MSELAETVRRAVAGDQGAFGSLVSLHRSMVVGVGLRILHDLHEAEDSAQETFARAWFRLDRITQPARFPGWLRSVARSVALNRLRRRKPTANAHALPATDLRSDPADGAEVAEFTRAVLDAIAALPDGWREPLEMFHFDGVRLREIATHLGIGEGNARTRLSRARQRVAAALTGRWPVEVISRAKHARGWLPSALAPRKSKESPAMKLTADASLRTLPRGDSEVVIRPLVREDLPSFRRFDQELEASLDEANAALPPGSGSQGGGPWSQDKWLAEHFEKYEDRGNLTLIAEQEDRIVGFADLWVSDEPPPFGRSLDVECVDYFREHYLLGIETVFLSEAERVARAAGLQALDIGTNTVSGDYVPLRRFGLRVFYEYDEAVFESRCDGAEARPEARTLSPGTADLSGLLKVSHWSPTDFGFRDENPWGGGSRLVELRWPHHRAILELWRMKNVRDPGHPPVPPNIPNRAELYVTAESLFDQAAMNSVLSECVLQAAEAGAEAIPLPIPSDLEIDPERLVAAERTFRYAWFRKGLA